MIAAHDIPHDRASFIKLVFSHLCFPGRPPGTNSVLVHVGLLANPARQPADGSDPPELGGRSTANSHGCSYNSAVPLLSLSPTVSIVSLHTLRFAVLVGVELPIPDLGSSSTAFVIKV